VRIEYAASFERDLRGVKDQSVRNQARLALETLKAAADLREIPNVKKLQGSDDMYRIRVGEYRIGAILDRDSLVLVRFLHRKDIYRYFP
jgi:mRNA interferase RelE/StbE